MWHKHGSIHGPKNAGAKKNGLRLWRSQNLGNFTRHKNILLQYIRPYKRKKATYIPTVHLRMMKIHGPAKQAYNTGFCNVLY